MLQLITDRIVYSFFHLNPQTRLGQAVNFFIYDTIKIFLLLFIMISVIGFFRTFLPQDKVKGWLSARKGLANLVAALFGAFTPFCSCSSIPIFLGFLEAGVPLGVTFSFLVTSPLINEYLVVLMFGFFGWKITVLYLLSGLAIGFFSGLILGRLKLEKYLVRDLVALSSSGIEEISCRSFKDRLSFGINEAFSIVRKLWFWIIAGVAAGALIHNYVPQELIQQAISRTGIFSVPIATLLGVPMYGSCAAIIPIAVALFQKGIPLGTSLSFMMAVAALSFPEAVLLRRAMRLQLIALFFGITAMGIIFTGYLFNFLQRILIR